VFLVKEGSIFTSPLSSGCLPGTMRQRVMQRVEVREAALTETDVASADEVFVTSAIRGVMPVIAIDGRSMRVGPVTAGLRG
jgi:branched-subunit amino acid aminotransferase/4-amino-4-deoxychorismate lyase